MNDTIRGCIGSGGYGAASAFLASNLHLIPETLNPFEGFAFGVLGRCVTEATQPVFNRIYAHRLVAGKQDLLNLLRVARFISSVALTAFACTAIGIPISLGTALLLQVTQLALISLKGTVFSRTLIESYSKPIIVLRE